MRRATWVAVIVGAFGLFYIASFLVFRPDSRGSVATAASRDYHDDDAVSGARQASTSTAVVFERFWRSSNVMMAMKEAQLLAKHLRPSDTVFEYGSGFSTAFFSKFVRVWHSVEHDAGWALRVRELTENGRCPNVHLHHVPPTSGADLAQRPSRQSAYRSYVAAIDAVDTPLDRVLVDGRARPQCAVHAIAKLRGPDSLVFLHDWAEVTFRQYYRVVLEFFDLIDAVNTGQGIAVLRPKPNATDIVQRKKNWPDWWN
jgi:hypothetical protein